MADGKFGGKKQDISLHSCGSCDWSGQADEKAFRPVEGTRASPHQPESLIQRDYWIFEMTKFISFNFVHILILPQIKLNSG